MRHHASGQDREAERMGYMKWILLIVLWGSTSGGFYGGEYDSEAACKKAGETLKPEAHLNWVHVAYSCSPKGDI